MSNKELSLGKIKIYDGMLTIKVDGRIDSLQIVFEPVECNFSVYLTRSVTREESAIKKYREDYRTCCKLLNLKSDFIITDDNISFENGYLQTTSIDKVIASTPITFEEYSNLITIFKLKGML